MGRIIAIDPGPRESAMVEMENNHVICHRYETNQRIVDALGSHTGKTRNLALEMVASYGMPVGKSVFETCVWIGRFIESWGGDYDLIYRKTVCAHICGSARAKDSNIRQALIDRFGGIDGEAKAIGGKKCGKCKGKGWFGAGRPVCPECGGKGYETPPGPLNGISGDEWAALAVAVTWLDGKDVKIVERKGA